MPTWLIIVIAAVILIAVIVVLKKKKKKPTDTPTDNHNGNSTDNSNSPQQQAWLAALYASKDELNKQVQAEQQQQMNAEGNDTYNPNSFSGRIRKLHHQV